MSTFNVHLSLRKIGGPARTTCEKGGGEYRPTHTMAVVELKAVLTETVPLQLLVPMPEKFAA